MPIPYQIDSNRAILRTRCVGNITLEETLHHFDQLESDPGCPPYLDVLLDITDLASMLTKDHLFAVEDRIRRFEQRVKFGACAIVAKSDALRSIGRLIGVIAKSHFDPARVFQDFLHAEFWLQSVRKQEPGQPSMINEESEIDD